MSVTHGLEARHTALVQLTGTRSARRGRSCRSRRPARRSARGALLEALSAPVVRACCTGRLAVAESVDQCQPCSRSPTFDTSSKQSSNSESPTSNRTRFLTSAIALSHRFQRSQRATSVTCSSLRVHAVRPPARGDRYCRAGPRGRPSGGRTRHHSGEKETRSEEQGAKAAHQM